MSTKLRLLNTSGSAFPIEGTIVPHLGEYWVDEQNMRPELVQFVVGDDGGQFQQQRYQVSPGALVGLERLIDFEINAVGELVAIGEAADELSINDEGELIMQVGTA